MLRNIFLLFNVNRGGKRERKTVEMRGVEPSKRKGEAIFYVGYILAYRELIILLSL